MPPIDPQTHDWNEYRLYLIQRLDDHSTQLTEIKKSLDTLIPHFAEVKVKVGIWGAIAGIVSGGIVSVVAAFLIKHLA